MQYNSEIGKIYDSIFFFYEFYHNGETAHECSNKYHDTEFMKHCFSQIDDKIELPELLRPLFCTGAVQTNPISEFFATEIDFLHDSIDDFIYRLSSNIDIIYQNTIDKIFNNSEKEKNNRILPSVAPAKYLEALDSLKEDDSFKLQVSLLIGNFNYAMLLFTGLLKQVYSYVDTLHSKYQKEIGKEFERIQSETNLKLYEKTLQHPITAPDKTVVSISLLNQFMILGPGFEQNSTVILVGLKHEEVLEDSFEISTVTLTDFLIACGNELRIKILDSVSENGELTLSQLSKMHDTSPATMVRHIEVLVNAQILQISRREGLQIFYKINVRLFRYMKNHVENFINKMQTEKGKNCDE